MLCFSKPRRVFLLKPAPQRHSGQGDPGRTGTEALFSLPLAGPWGSASAAKARSGPAPPAPPPGRPAAVQYSWGWLFTWAFGAACSAVASAGPRVRCVPPPLPPSLGGFGSSAISLPTAWWRCTIRLLGESRCRPRAGKCLILMFFTNHISTFQFLYIFLERDLYDQILILL